MTNSTRGRRVARRRVHFSQTVDAESAAAVLRAAGIDASATQVANNAPPLFAMTGTQGFSEVTVPRDQARAARRLLRSAARRGLTRYYKRRFGMSPYQLQRGRTVAVMIAIGLATGFALMIAIAILATR